MNEAKKKLIILDRDGVINLDSDNYIKSPEEWVAIDSSLKAIANLNRAGYKVAVATNQSGIARGLFDQLTLTMIHKKMEMELAKVGAHIDALEFCPDHPDNPGADRKPNPGMINKLAKLFNIEVKDIVFVGDTISDIQCALNAGCEPILVLTGKGERTIKNKALPENITTFENLGRFVDSLLAE